MVIPSSLAAEPVVSFSAKEAEADLEKRELRLRGDVEIGFERFRLRSDELLLCETAEGVAAVGPARVTFCDCLEAPVAIGFERAEIEAPGDLKLHRPRLEVGGVTVLALPWFWLRAPSQPGLLPPKIAWRGGDGLLLGGGGHLPWGEGESALDLGLAGYTRGGFELTTALRTPGSTAHLRWDRLRGDLVALDALGSTTLGSRTDLAWDVDAIRGPRARAGTIDLEAAARAYDHAAVESTTRLGPLILGTGARGIAARGSSGMGAGQAFGPRLSLAAGTALGSDGVWDALATGEVLAAPEAIHVLRAESELAFAARPGPFATRIAARESVMLMVSESTTGLEAALSARAEAGLPLVREFGGEEEPPLVHLIEPRAELTGLLSRISGDSVEPTSMPRSVGEGGALLASAGLRTALGRRFESSGASLEMAMGALLPTETERPEPLARYRASFALRHFGLEGEGASLLARQRRGQVALGRARFGALDASHLSLRIAGREGVEPIAARMLATSSLRSASGGWLAWPGWSAGLDAGSWLSRSVWIEAGADADATTRALLGVRAAAGYAHPCGCLAANLHGQRRLGREGVDVWATVDLTP